MINSLLVCDNKDEDLGAFFEKCKTRTEEILNSSEQEINIDNISGNAAFEVLVPLKTASLNFAPYLFISFSHGSENELLQNGSKPFISLSDQENHLKNTLAYCYACDAGSKLGKSICDNDTLTFIGYNKKVTIQMLFHAEGAFVDCAVSGIKKFVEGGTTKDMLSYLKEKHNQYIDELYEINFPTAMVFMSNRDALVLYGNKKLTIKDFIQNSLS